MLSLLSRDDAVLLRDGRLARAVHAITAALAVIIAVDLVSSLASGRGDGIIYTVGEALAAVIIGTLWIRGDGGGVRVTIALSYALLIPHLVGYEILSRNTPLAILTPTMIALVLDGPAIMVASPILALASSWLYLGRSPFDGHVPLAWFVAAFVFSLALANRMITDRAVHTMRRRADALERTQNLVTGISDSVQVGVLVYTPDRRCIYWNHFMSDLTDFEYKPGMETDAIATIEALSGREAAEKLAECIDRAVQGENMELPDSLMTFSNIGRTVWLSRRFSPYRMNGQVIGVVETVKDTTSYHHLQDELIARNSDILMAYERTLEGWVAALDLRDNETRGHSDRVVIYTVRFARAARFSDDDIVHIRRGALLHDIGKIAIPDSILKKSGSLTTDEWAVMRSHPIRALDFLRGIEFLRPALNIPLHHHERWDGSGYPHGLAGHDIPAAARLFSIVDVFDALRSDRPYREAWSIDRTLEHLREYSGKYFDPELVELFERVKPWEETP